MIQDSLHLINDFVDTYNRNYNGNLDESEITHELHKAPHIPPKLMPGKGAVYIFSLTENINSPAGSHRVLKVGKVGQNSEPRFRYQHYKPNSAMSTLSGAIESKEELWEYLGFDASVDVGLWIKENTDRDHFFIDGSKMEIISVLERYLMGLLMPVFEG